MGHRQVHVLLGVSPPSNPSITEVLSISIVKVGFRNDLCALESCHAS